MKNLKVRKKLIVGFTVVLLMMIVITLLSVSGMKKLNEQSDVLVEKTLPNTQMIWEIRRNNLSAARYILMAFLEEDAANISKNLDLAAKDANASLDVMQRYKENARVDKSMIDALESTLQQQKEIRERIDRTLRQNTEESHELAHDIYLNEFFPLSAKQNENLSKIHDEQVRLAEHQAAFGEKVYEITVIITLCVAAAAILISMLVIGKLGKAIVVPLTQIENATKALAKGDFSLEVTYESGDEFGQTCDSIRESFAELRRIISRAADTLRQMAGGNFAVDTRMDFPGEMREIETASHDLVERMNALFQEVKSSSSQINGGAAQVSNGAQALAQGATEQASSIQQLSASIMDISGNVNVNAENSKKANELATISGEVAKSTLAEMEQMLNAMNEISVSAENIGKVVKVIDDITFQTNILSLNAAVEAARAGAAGKGFAVVADEVRNLAQKSSESAKEIAELIESAILSVREGEGIAKKTSEAFNDLAGKIADVIATVNEIAAASEDQAVSISQITVGVDQISAVVQTNSATSEESAAASEELSSQAHVLDELLSQFKMKDEYALGAEPAAVSRGQQVPSYGGYDKY